MPKQILSLLIIGVIVLMGGISFIFFNPEKHQGDVSSLSQEKWDPQTIQEAQDFTTQAVDKKDEELCFQFTQCLYQSTCLVAVAAAKRDANICSMQVKDCEGLELFRESGEAIGDIAPENIAAFAKDTCIRDIELEKIKDVSGKNDHTLCSALQGTIGWFGNDALKKDICLMQVAVNTENPTLCGLIENGGLADTLGFTLFENCYNFSTYQEEEMSQELENPFPEFFGFFPANGEFQTCMKNTLGENFIPAYQGIYRGKDIMESFETCMEPKDGEGPDRAAARLLPDSLPCIEQGLGPEEFKTFLADPMYVISLDANEQIKSCPFIKNLNTIGDTLLEYVE